MVRHSVEFLEKRKAKLMEKRIRLCREAIYQLDKVMKAGEKIAEEHKNAGRLERAILVLADTRDKYKLVDALYKGYCSRVEVQILAVEKEIEEVEARTQV